MGIDCENDKIFKIAAIELLRRWTRKHSYHYDKDGRDLYKQTIDLIGEDTDTQV